MTGRLLKACTVALAMLGCRQGPNGQAPMVDKDAAILPTVPSLSARHTPAWFGNAKLGIFVHLGLYSVPGWATPIGTPDTVTNWHYFYSHNPYAEWYLNTLRIAGSPTALHHAKTYGTNFDYYQFADSFNLSMRSFDASRWMKLFRSAGARYVVLTAKHSEGFTLYPSTVAHPFYSHERINAHDDIVGAVAWAARSAGMRFGVYYSGGLDWSFSTRPVTNLWPDLFQATPQSVAYAGYADMQMFELIHRYRPDILWNDVSYPTAGDMLGILAELFTANPEAVVNERWGRNKELTDFDTPEYRILDSVSTRKWESCRGIGYSFGFNRMETDSQFISGDDLVRMLVDIVSKNGNLLLDVGPMADGTIPAPQAQRLEYLGRWLERNGESIFDTRPWKQPQTVCPDGTLVRFTQTDSALFVTLMKKPQKSSVVVPGIRLRAGAAITLLQNKQAIKWEQADNGIEVTLPSSIEPQPAYVLRMPLPAQ